MKKEVLSLSTHQEIQRINFGQVVLVFFLHIVFYKQKQLLKAKILAYKLLFFQWETSNLFSKQRYLNLLPGIESGDIGPKIGFLKVDNGYLRVNNVEVPRENLLSRYVQV
jgi:hypothetical protein